jgi:hypothetical protein
VTDGPSLPPPRYAHTLHVEAPQPKPFAFLLGVALLAFAVPAGLVFAFLRVVAEPPAPVPVVIEPAPAPAAEPSEPAPALALVEAPDASDAFDASVAEASSPADAAARDASFDAAPIVALVSDASVIDAAPAAPSVPMTYELGMGILHSCRNEAGKYFEGFQDCGSAGELDRYLSRVVGQEIVACAESAPTTPVTVRTSVNFGALTGTIDVVDWKMTPVPSPFASCLASHFVLENLAKIRHQHPKYTLTYRIIPHPLGAQGH